MFNEKPPPDELLAASDIGKAVTTSLPESVVSFLFSKSALCYSYNEYLSSVWHLVFVAMFEPSSFYPMDDGRNYVEKF